MNKLITKNNFQKKIVLFSIIYWLFWLFYNFYNGYEISNTTYFLVLISIFSFFIGWRTKRISTKITNVYNPVKKLKYLRFFVITYSLLILLISILSILKNGFITHREIIFQPAGIFNSVGLNFLHQTLFRPLTLAAIIIFFCVRKVNVNFIKTAYFLLIIISIYELGRFTIYYLIFFLFIDRIILNKNLTRTKLNNKIKSYFIIFFIVSTSIFIQLRKITLERGNVDVVEVIQKFGLNYHVVGFHMLDKFVINDIQTDYYSFPSTSLGEFGWYVELLTKYSEVLPVFKTSFRELMEYFNDGIFIEELDFPYNSFTTNILPFYADGGLFGVIFMFFIIGRISKLGKNYSIYRINPIFITTVLLFTFSLFMPLFSIYLIPIIFLISVFNIILRIK